MKHLKKSGNGKMTKVIVDGNEIASEKDFYNAIKNPLDFGPYFGNNLDAFWDRLYRDVERPACIVWKSHEASKKNMGNAFIDIIRIMDRAKKWDEKNSPENERFTYFLE